MKQAIIVGRLGQDAELKFFESGACKASFSLAVSRWDSQKKEEQTDWFNVECWNKLAEFAGEHLKKGNLVVVLGEFKKEKYEKDGEQKTAYKVVAEKINFSGAFCIEIGANISALRIDNLK